MRNQCEFHLSLTLLSAFTIHHLLIWKYIRQLLFVVSLIQYSLDMIYLGSLTSSFCIIRRVVGNKLIIAKSTQSPSYLPAFMRSYFSHVLVNCMHAIHFPQSTLSFFSSKRSDWGIELYGRYISVQEHSTERVGSISMIYSKSKSPAGKCCQSHWHHLRVTSKHWVGKNRDSCLQIQQPVVFFVGDGN